MHLKLDESIASGYTSSSQRARVMTEAWAAHNIFCANCGSGLRSAPANTPATDYYCGVCDQSYELKSRKGRHTSKVVDGAYSTMIEKIRREVQPNLLLLSYDKASYVTEVSLVPSHFLVESVVEQRSPLPATAKRSGWVGCNLLLSKIPSDGRFFYVRSSYVINRECVFQNWRRSQFIRRFNPLVRNWIVAVMSEIRALGQRTFTLNDLYCKESEFKNLFPGNRNIRAKIRQQLQRLRDCGWLMFLGNGVYRRLD